MILPYSAALIVLFLGAFQPTTLRSLSPLRYIAVFILLGLVLSGCDSGGPDPVGNTPFDPGLAPWEFDPGQIEYANVDFVSTTGGFGGGRVRHALLDENGLMTKEQFHGVPAFSRQLSKSEHDSLMLLLYTPMTIPAGQEGTCADAPFYEAAFSNRFYSGRFHSYCGIETDERFPEAYNNRARFLGEFARLYDMMLSESSPWIGVETSFHLSKETFNITESISIVVTFNNPTERSRTVYIARDPFLSLAISLGDQQFRTPRGSWNCTAGVRLDYSSDCLAPTIELAPRSSRTVVSSVPISSLGFQFDQNATSALEIKAEFRSHHNGYAADTLFAFVAN